MNLGSDRFSKIDATKFQVFTPSELVIRALNLAGYSGNIFTKKFLETSCGDGAFLVQVVKRYIESALANGLNLQRIKRGLETNIVGYEIDKEIICQAKENLDQVAKLYGIEDVQWRLYTADILFEDINEKFDYIVGNPPYLEYKSIDNTYRELLKKKFSVCSNGKFDYCYAFIEASLSLLKTKGVLVQIIPNSIFKNKSAIILRNLLLPLIDTIIDYSSINIFKQAQISPCVIRLKKDTTVSDIKYIRITDNKCLSVEKQSLTDKWFFFTINDKKRTKRFGDYFKASMPIATLYNDAFLIEKDTKDIETKILLDACSPKSIRGKKSMQIIFPYRFGEDDSLKRYNEQELATLFPNTFTHLLIYKNELMKRNADNKSSWFEYGRQQGFSVIKKEKLLLSTIVTNNVNVYKLPNMTIPYGGLVITTMNQNTDLEKGRQLLQSKEFLEYAHNVGTCISGKSVRITCKDIAEFRFSDTTV